MGSWFSGSYIYPQKIRDCTKVPKWMILLLNSCKRDISILRVDYEDVLATQTLFQLQFANWTLCSVISGPRAFFFIAYMKWDGDLCPVPDEHITISYIGTIRTGGQQLPLIGHSIEARNGWAQSLVRCLRWVVRAQQLPVQGKRTSVEDFNFQSSQPDSFQEY